MSSPVIAQGSKVAGPSSQTSMLLLLLKMRIFVALILELKKEEKTWSKTVRKAASIELVRSMKLQLVLVLILPDRR
jgi:hypothetical protein